MSNNPDTIKELDAMRAVAEALKSLEEDSVRRVINWAADHFGITLVKATKNTGVEEAGIDESIDDNGIPNYGDVADLYAAAGPTTDAHKALVVAYWVQFMEGIEGIDAQAINTKLKHMGYGIGNITRAFESLKKTKPQLIVQLRKSGSSKQARKTFKITNAGKKFVEDLLQKGDF